MARPPLTRAAVSGSGGRGTLLSPHWRLSRRGLLAGAAAGGGLLVAWLAWPDADGPRLPSGRNDLPFGAWLTIGRDGVVTVAVPQVETGQGISTLLPQVVAEELGADWRLIAVQPVPPHAAFANVPLAQLWEPLWAPSAPVLARLPGGVGARAFARRAAFAATAAGTALAAYEEPCRRAGAAARALLVEAASRQWNVAPAECLVADGLITCGERRATFGALAPAAARLDAPDDAGPAPPAQPDPRAQARAGPNPFPRLDLPSKASGSTLFAGDVRLPNLVHASIRHGPAGAPFLAGFDAAAARGIAGLVRVVRSKRWLAAVAESWWMAERALDAMRPRFGGGAPVSSAAMTRMLDAALEQDGEVIAASGSVDPSAAGLLTATYRIAPAVHAALETASATARISGNRLELWLAAQAPAQALAAAARAVRLRPEDAVLYPVAGGGSFDARLDHTHAIEAAVIAEAVGRPVQLTWPRRQELLALPHGPFVHVRVGAAFQPGGEPRIGQWSARFAAPAWMRQMGHRLFDNMTATAALRASAGVADPLALRDAVPPYAIPNVAVEHVPVDLPLPAGPVRGNGAAVAAFCTESMIDELAARAGREPLSWRIAMLGHDPRLAACLLAVAEMAQWDGAGRSGGQGLACARLRAAAENDEDGGGGRIACIAAVDAAGGQIAVRRLFAAVDLGRIVNADIARQQIEGGLLFGLTMALGGQAAFAGGLPVSDRLGDLAIAPLARTPQIEVRFVGDEAAPPFDPGELGTVVAPPAIANALFAATGRRIRALPLLENA
ncbi:xanthine dehydrogenase family protein molybdopterin-binding subunit [Erythrobacteraceae bacterium CFH 75059]|uniref:molybdopterin cofactor-binding domain-containing protein n=1 Tax=Qipengyuania thermophila TaxID=2509361 RepID=UPI001020D92B|nr:molybdopterin cofactor-binding domain-containing protein [Qipengyuania thermophila]TCD06401.1 xanthine dehydrogenase family protein molybdopterin-binding subunit [Erythrobacteraceae bacterium CFH 75059]